MARRSRTQPSQDEIAKLKKRIRAPGAGPYVKACVYGVNGSGKTRFAGTAPKLLLLDISEEGDRSIKSRKGVRVLPVRNWEDVGNAYWYLKSGDHPFESVALDTITAMHELAMDFVLGEAEERDPTRERAMPDQRSWGRSGQLTKAMLLAFRNLPLHVIFTAQERVIRDDDTEEPVEITVDLPRGCRGTATGSVGILGRMMPIERKVKKAGRTRKVWEDRLFVGRHEITHTKDRTGTLDIYVREPTVPLLIEAWNS